jgi:hypothetical protein
VKGQLHTLATLPPGKEPQVSTGYEDEWVPEPVWMTWKGENCYPSWDLISDPLAIQATAKHCTNHTIAALILRANTKKKIIAKMLHTYYRRSTDLC